MNRIPTIFGVDEIRRWDVAAEINPGHWVPARPMGMETVSLVWRIKAAWLVFTGRMDVLRWRER